VAVVIPAVAVILGAEVRLTLAAAVPALAVVARILAAEAVRLISPLARRHIYQAAAVRVFRGAFPTAVRHFILSVVGPQHTRQLVM
jgi:hypothetical protein